MKRLCRCLNLRLWQAVGVMESLWHLTARECPRGDLGKLSDEDIALGIDWEGDPRRLIEALLACGWLERDAEDRLRIHDWHEHADDAVHSRVARAKSYFVGGYPPKLAKLGREERADAHKFYNGYPAGTRRAPFSPGGSQPEPTPEPEPVPEPVPVPEPEPGPSRPASPPVGGAAGPSLSGLGLVPSLARHFDDWWMLWVATRGSNHKTLAEKAFNRLVDKTNLLACIECTASYLQSLSDPARGYNPENFLEEQARDLFTARWPACRVDRKEAESERMLGMIGALRRAP